MTSTVFSHAGLLRDRLVDLGQEALADADVGERVVVADGAEALAEEARVDEATAGSVPAAASVRNVANGLADRRYFAPHSARNGSRCSSSRPEPRPPGGPRSSAASQTSCVL